MKTARQALFLLLAVSLAGLALGGGRLFERLLWSALFILGTAWLWPRLVIRRLEVIRQPYMTQGRVGDLFREQFRVIYHGRLLVPWLEVADETPWPDRAAQQRPSSRVITGLGRGQSRLYLSRTWLTRRGVFPLGPTRLTVGDPFGLFPVTRVFPPKEKLVVLPFIFPIEVESAAAGRFPGGRAIRRPTGDITPYTAGLRAYLPGDPLRRIHWPATAHQGRWMVREFEDDRQDAWWIFLDATASVQYHRPDDKVLPRLDRWWFYRRPQVLLPPDTLEYGVSLAASLANWLLQRRLPLGFAAAGPLLAPLPPERDARHLFKVMRALTYLQSEDTLSLAALLMTQAERLPRGSVALVITPAADDMLVQAISRLTRRGVQVWLFWIDPATFGAAPVGHNFLAQVRAAGGRVLLVEYGSDFAQLFAKWKETVYDRYSHA